MYIRQNVYVGGAEEIAEIVKEADEKFYQVEDLLNSVSLRSITLDVDINRYPGNPENHISLSGVKEAIINIQGAINGFEHVLTILKRLPDATKELNEKINQPLKRS